MESLKVSLVIPAKNEEGSIASVIAVAKPLVDELLVVDGHSTDRTVEIAESLGVRVVQDPGRGKGCALRYGAEQVTGDIVVFMDADGSHNAIDIPALVTPIKESKADMVIGSRLLGGSDEIHGNFSNYVRMVGAGFITLIINMRWNQELTDVENGFRAIRRNALPAMQLAADDFDIEQEMVMKALKCKLRIAEVPSHEFKRSAGRSKLPTWKGVKFIWRLIWLLF